MMAKVKWNIPVIVINTTIFPRGIFVDGIGLFGHYTVLHVLPKNGKIPL